MDIAPNREQIRRDVQGKLDEDLRRFSITVEDLLIDNIDFTPNFKDSIERKQIAAQEKLRQAEEAERLREEKRGTADAERIEAEGNRDARVERATGEADAIRKLAEAYRELDASLTPQVLQYFAVDKLADDLDLALLPSGQGVIIDPAMLLSQVDDDEDTGATTAVASAN